MSVVSIDPGALDIKARRGKTWKLWFTLRDSAGQLMDLTGYSAAWQARVTATTPKAALSCSTGDGITIAEGAVENQIAIVVPAATTAAIPARRYVHEIELTEPGGGKPPFLAGSLVVTPVIVR